MINVHLSSPFALHVISLASKGMPKDSSHQPAEYPAFMWQIFLFDFSPFFRKGSASKDPGWWVTFLKNSFVVFSDLRKIGTMSGETFAALKFGQLYHF